MLQKTPQEKHPKKNYHFTSEKQNEKCLVTQNIPLVKFRGNATPLVLVYANIVFLLVKYISCSNPRQVPHTGK